MGAGGFMTVSAGVQLVLRTLHRQPRVQKGVDKDREQYT